MAQTFRFRPLFSGDRPLQNEQDRLRRFRDLFRFATVHLSPVDQVGKGTFQPRLQVAKQGIIHIARQRVAVLMGLNQLARFEIVEHLHNA